MEIFVVLLVFVYPKVSSLLTRFGDWFTAERGTGPNQNGWVGGNTPTYIQMEFDFERKDINGN